MSDTHHVMTGVAAATTESAPTLRDRLSSHPASIYYLMLGSTLFLLLLGLIMVWSSSAIDSIRDTGGSTDLVAKQALFAFLGLGAMFLAARLPAATVRNLAWPTMIVALVLLVLVLIPGIGVEVAGQQNWIDLGGPFRLQPSEIAKLALVVWGADVLTRKYRPVTDWPSLLVPLAPVGGILVVLVMLEGDFGNAMILGFIVMGLFFAVGAPLRLFAAFAVIGVSGVLFASVTTPYRMRRWTAFLDPNADELDGAWQVTQGTYALGTGGWFGTGIGGSREKWGSLPAAHTDFIFPVIGEELGLIGTVTVLALFAVLVFAILRLAKESPDRFTRLLAAGTATWLIIQVITNIGAALKMLPITGVVLPMLSYGGSSLIPLLTALGLLLGAARRHPVTLQRHWEDTKQGAST
jgi:cell division protein FtsW